MNPFNDLSPGYQLAAVAVIGASLAVVVVTLAVVVPPLIERSKIWIWEALTSRPEKKPIDLNERRQQLEATLGRRSKRRA